MTMPMTDCPQPVKEQLLGEILLARGLITKARLKDALLLQKLQGGRLGAILVSLGYLGEREIVAALSVQLHVPYIAVDRYAAAPDATALVPEGIARKYRVIPLARVKDILSLVMANPEDAKVQSELARITRSRIAPFIATAGEIEAAIRQSYAV